MKFAFYCLVLSSLMAGSCASPGGSLAIGAGTGMTTGIVMGAILPYENKGRGILGSALIGGGLGLLGGYLIHRGLQKRDARIRKETLFNLGNMEKRGSSFSLKPPHLVKPVVDSHWVERRIEGNKLIEGHRVWIIQENSRWIPPSNKKDEKNKK